MLKSLIYISTAIDIMDYSELMRILEVSRRNNEPFGITGLLVYYDGAFVQVLEGKAEHVDLIFSKIKVDDRHKNVTLLNEDMINEREFGAWDMAFRFLQTDDVLKSKGFVSLNELDFGEQVQGGSSKHILKNFYELNIARNTRDIF